MRLWVGAEPLVAATTRSPLWLVGILSGRIQDGRPFQCLVVLDACGGVPLSLQVASHWSPSRLAASLEQLVAQHEAPQRLSGITPHPDLQPLLQRWCDTQAGLTSWLPAQAAMTLLAEDDGVGSGCERLEHLLDRLEQRCGQAVGCRSLRQLQRAMDDWIVADAGPLTSRQEKVSSGRSTATAVAGRPAA